MKHNLGCAVALHLKSHHQKKHLWLLLFSHLHPPKSPRYLIKLHPARHSHAPAHPLSAGVPRIATHVSLVSALSSSYVRPHLHRHHRKRPLLRRHTDRSLRPRRRPAPHLSRIPGPRQPHPARRHPHPLRRPPFLRRPRRARRHHRRHRSRPP